MKIIIAGSRSITDYEIVKESIESFLKNNNLSLNDVEIVSGGALGVDNLGEQWADRNKVRKTIFKANWEKYGKKAGMLRNNDMRKYADALIAVYDGKSVGTKQMIDQAYKHNLKVMVVRPNDVQYMFFT